MVVMPKEYVSEKRLERDEWNTARLIVNAIETINSYFCVRNPEDSEGDPDVLKNIATEIEKRIDLPSYENLEHFLSFINQHNLKFSRKKE